MTGIKIDQYKGVYWRAGVKSPIALCPTHKIRLEIRTRMYGLQQQETKFGGHDYLVCPEDSKNFKIFGDTFWDMQKRYQSTKEALALKTATIVDLDNVYTPKLKMSLSPKDDRYSVQVEIDETPTGKKLVIYAADRKNLSEKTQIFIDPQSDKITFDSKGDIHPNMIFSKVVAYFKDGKKATLEEE
ncbi:MAG: hypothetical protein Q7T74_07315 [Candidatus Saccharibacteria bacterium]|nr:hypothetical protein [Candidatus Saccharibacteria bacterium]